VTLPPREFFPSARYLMKHRPGGDTHHVVENVWYYHFDPQTNVIDCALSRLRSTTQVFERPWLAHDPRRGYMILDGIR